jgi:protein-disulfide isomerase-like protein with CxxC motif
MGGAQLQLPYLNAIFRVHLQEGKDVSDIEVLSDVAAEIGMLTKAEVRWQEPCTPLICKLIKLFTQ